MYGQETLAQVEAHAREVASALDAEAAIPVRVVRREVATSPGSIRRVVLEANAAESCLGVITWMHTFSPAKMWIGGLSALHKPLLHLHTQFNRELPWAEIDMDFMNLNQSAHGDREFGVLETRMRLAPQDRRRPLARPAGRGAHRHLGRAAASAGARRSSCGLPASATTCARSRSQEGTGRGADPAGLCPSTATAWATRGRGRERRRGGCGRPRRRRTASCTTLGARAPRGGARRGSFATLPAWRSGCVRSSSAGGFGAFTDTFEELDGLNQLPGIACSG